MTSVKSHQHAVRQESGVSMDKTYKSIQEVLAETQNPAYKEMVGLNIKMILTKYRNKAVWKDIKEAEKKRE